MKFRWLASAVLAAGLIGFLAGSGFSEDEAPSEEEMMKMMMELAQPGEPHQALQPFIGEWDVVSKSWMKPGEPPEVTSATCSSTWFLGGRFMKTHFEGDFHGQPFTGAGLVGYDNFKKHYTSIWVDTWSSGILPSTGSAEDGVITLEHVWDGPIGKIPGRMVYEPGENDTWTLTGYMTMAGQEMKHMELTFTRKAAAPPVSSGRVARPVCPPANTGPGY
jgi:hypothetical protein